MNETLNRNNARSLTGTSCAASSSAASGFAMLELIIAAGLLAAAVGIVATCAVAAQRVQRQQLQHTLAVDELSNQLERLTALPLTSDIDSLLQQLQPSDWAVQRLPGATVTGKRLDDQWGERVELQLQWTRGGNPPPLVAVAWLRSEISSEDES